jgi:hypothetical protein
MHRVSQILLIVAGIIHLLPLAGVLGPAHLARLYGIDLSDPDLIILMRHRAVLLALAGALLLAAAWRLELRPAAYLLGGVSVVSFLALAWSSGGYNPLIARVVSVDVVAAVCLLAALACDQFAPPKKA